MKALLIIPLLSLFLISCTPEDGVIFIEEDKPETPAETETPTPETPETEDHDTIPI